LNFSTAPKVLQTIRAGDNIAWVRGQNRVKINSAANNFPPLSAEMAKKIGLKINSNWGELMIALQHARNQLMNAFWSSQYFFKVKIPRGAPQDKQADWETFITNEINSIMKESQRYYQLHKSKWAAVACHGIGPMVWYSRDRWLPEFLSIADLRVATDTLCDFSNLTWWAYRKNYTPFELVEEVFENPRGKWKKDGIIRLLKGIKELNFQDSTQNYDWETNPEKLHDIVKQNGGFYGSDAVPTIPLYHFFFEDYTKKKTKGIWQVIVPDTTTVKEGKDQVFLWEDDEPVAESREELLHVQFGDLNNDAPFLFWNTRSLGLALMEPTYWTNITRCRMLQHLHDNFNIMLRVTDPPDKARALIQEFANMGVIRPGVNVLGQNERHQVDARLVEQVLAQLKQLQQEASASYTQQTDTGTQKEQTAFETRVKLEQVNAMMGAMLMDAFVTEKFAYKEIARRFTLPKSEDPDVLLFQKRCAKYNIPREFVDSTKWEIEPVTPLGMGNPTLGAAAANQLFEMRGAYEPEAQQEILHEVTLEATKDPRKAARWAPIGRKRGPQDAQKFAEADFNILMRGIPAQIMQGSNPIGQIETILGLLAGEITALNNTGGMADAREIMGLHTVEQHVGQLIQIASSDEANVEKLTAYKKALGKLMNETKAFEQRLAAQNGKQRNGQDAESNAKIGALLATTQAKIHAKSMTDKQKMDMKKQQFAQEQRRKDAETFAKIQRDNITHKVNAANKMKSLRE
jgi:hypothetical protein